MKPLADFGRRGERDGQPLYRSRCKACQAEAARNWYRKNPERAAATQRRRKLQRGYDLTPEQYEALLATQGGVCAICGRPERVAREGKPVRLAVDHCHTTGAIRGLLCTSCNRALGLFGEDVHLMEACVQYLDRDRAKSH
jgi:hypothetical protein